MTIPSTSPPPAPGETLVWYRPERITQRFELRRGQAAMATLTFDAAPAIAWELTARHAATAESADARWRITVARRGFLGLKADVHVEGTNEGVLEASYLLRKATVSLSQMPGYQWAGSITKNSSDVFLHPERFPVVRFDRGSYFDRVNARVAVLAEATPRDIVLLASLGLYMRLLMNKIYR